MFTNMSRQRPDFQPIFNRLLPKMRLIPGLCLGSRWGAYTAPQTPSWTELGHKPILSGSMPLLPHTFIPSYAPGRHDNVDSQSHSISLCLIAHYIDGV